MGVNAVQNYENSNRMLSRVITSTVVGGIIGYGAKTAIPLQKREKMDINYRAIINSTRKDANLHKANAFKILKERTPAQDAFIEMIDHKETFKAPTLKVLAERLGGENTEIGKKVLSIINDEANKNLDFDGLINTLGKDSAEAKKLLALRKSNNGFAKGNLEFIMSKLGGKASDSGKEFTRIINEVNKTSSDNARTLLEAWHKVIKAKRYAAPLVIAGAAAGFAAAFIHNVLSTKTEA